MGMSGVEIPPEFWALLAVVVAIIAACSMALTAFDEQDRQRDARASEAERREADILIERLVEVTAAQSLRAAEARSRWHGTCPECGYSALPHTQVRRVA